MKHDGAFHNMKNFLEISPAAERLVDAAQVLIQENGYNGFSYENLSRAVGLKKPSLHHHFPTKEGLGVTVVQRYTYRFLLQLRAIDDEYALASERLRAYVDLFIATYGQTKRLCPCGILGAESETLPIGILNEVRTFFDANLAWLAVILEAGRQAGEFHYQGTTDAAALQLLSALEGAMVVGRGLGSDTTVTEVGEAVVLNLLAGVATS